jgi:D-aspartate ligase
MSSPLDSSVPALLVKLGRYPYHHGGLGLVRSLGRAGVRIYAITEDRFTPVARSRYLAGRFAPLGDNPIEQLRDIGRRIGRPTVVVATDDGAALLLAEHANQLREQFLLPQVAPGLPRMLASKHGMAELCQRENVPTPRTMYPTTVDELRDLTFPVVLKRIEPWARGPAAVSSTTVVANTHDLADRIRGAQDLTGLLVQEYIPPEHSEDWFAMFYADATSTPLVMFTGRKVRAWPAKGGVTADGRANANAELAELTTRFVRAVGWQGPASLDWRWDRRDGRYKLVDFNVRLGALFRCGQTEDGIDVVRALHLDLTGRPPAPAAQDVSRRLVVGNLLLPSVIGGRIAGLTRPASPPAGSRTERAWLAADDPLPAVVMATRGLRSVAGSLWDTYREWRAYRRGM